MKKITVNEVEIEFDDNVDYVEIRDNKIIVKGKDQLPTIIPYYPTYPNPYWEPFKITYRGTNYDSKDYCYPYN